MAALTTALSPTKTWSPIVRGKKATLRKRDERICIMLTYIDYELIESIDYQPSAEFFERRPYDGVLTDDTITSRSHVRQIASDNSIRLYNHFSVQHDILRPA